ncbi:L,D-transpeptidase-like protein [Nocardioides albertanoniae]|uniref:L,D-transpeptidase-like protein n=1 Tax=Nocardioides albertanoniae TaxID=1175486 RepID=A0A543A429_9ACTN|nr:L,D-transpeptidase [Nocardioides albertanoniae]TQL67332.1 L,D-transpeptidase-like protein [Nocardioides albertanoniae]
MLTSAGIYGGVEILADPRATGEPVTGAAGARIDPDVTFRDPISPIDAQREADLSRRLAERRITLEKALPERSGDGRRAVFSISRQRVWIVSEKDRVRRTYPVSGSVYDNLKPGRYKVFSRSEHARGIDDSGTMRWFVRFTKGPNAAIGFHNIPVDKGKRVQTRGQLGTPLSHGCVRQAEPDAKAMWRFASVGTRVVVTR